MYFTEYILYMYIDIPLNKTLATSTILLIMFFSKLDCVKDKIADKLKEKSTRNAADK